MLGLSRRATCAVLLLPGVLAAQSLPPVDPLFASGFEPDAASQILAAKTAPDGAVSIRIDGATVTFVRQQEGTEAAGFHLQATRTGPALFVRVDPALVQPALAAGDVVDLTVLSMATVALRREAVAIGAPVVRARGTSLAALTQRVDDAADLAAAIATYDAKLVRAVLRIVSAASVGADGFATAQVATRAVADDPRLVLRVPLGVATPLGLRAGCVISLDGAPIRQDGPAAQWVPRALSTFSPQDCTAFGLAEAIATSSTSVRLRFNRIIDASSATAPEFALSGLTVTGATANGPWVDLTTNPQSSGLVYSVTVGPSLRDVSGERISNGIRNATFVGY